MSAEKVFPAVLPRVSVALFATVLTVAGCVWISQKYFFDLFYYEKSPMYGYGQKDIPLIAQKNNPLVVEARIADLRQAFSSTPSKVLGVEDDPKTYEVLIIGDSMVYGNGVQNDQRLAKVLEKKLSHYRPTKVYDLALPGDSLIDNYYKFERAKAVYSPDLVIFGLFENDLILNAKDRYPGEEGLYAHLRTECPQPEYYNDPDALVPNDIEEKIIDVMFTPTFEPGTANFCYLEVITRKLSAQQNLFFYSFRPVAEQYADPSNPVVTKTRKLIQSYIQVVQQAGIPVVSPDNLESFSYQAVSVQEAHPNAATHAQYATSIERELLSNARWGFVQK